MNIAIIGAGLMGHALALVFAIGGHRVRLTDSNPEALARAPGLMEKARATLEREGEAGGLSAEGLRERVTLHDTLAATVADAALVIEAIIEKPEPKRALFAELDALMPAEALLASNTSYLDVFPLMPPARLPRALIMHWYTPPYLVDLVDLVGSPECPEAVVEELAAELRRMGKVPLVMRRFLPGYIANRLQSALSLECYRLMDEGYATPQEIDEAIIHGLGLRLLLLGQMAKGDFTGLPLSAHALANRMYAPPEPQGRSATLDAALEQGRTGVMAGRGFYDWGGADPATLMAERDRRLIALKRALRQIGPMAGLGAGTTSDNRQDETTR
ncbi:3-hydroxyacyl-CoA dehydrogenase family protein [Pseudoroseomonas cervicalis]|uniref:3-hydroxyacyl-CoA dehydrogenase family protein n=1 Tax=Teichococcus cervicalis TaxID=204525 RepID=UPI00278A3E7B|nr:3-hydroxyacyl-CoA dehydrogenase family protein [Pseudoroseomonas cervicalis]MDQ1078584.1 3-hydroxybutyryl-CoA dehydrogenase [Pseudoroseomonas cervicalis]